MKVQKVSVEKLTVDPSNARKHNPKNLESIKGSLQKFGQQKPIVVDKNNVVVAGNGTLEAARSLGWTEIDVVETQLEGPESIAFALADNRTSELAEWDTKNLSETLKSLVKIDFDLDSIGFDAKDLAKFIPHEIKGGLTPDDEVPEQVETRCKPGDLWILGEHRLLCGDSTDVLQVERLMGGEKADMVFTDPPYGVNYEGIKNDDRGGLEDLLNSSLSNSSIVSNPGASCYVFHSDKCADIFHHVFRKYCHFSSMLIWVKPSLVLSRTDYQSQHEPCLYGWFNTGTHKWYGDRKQTSLMNFGKETDVKEHTTPKPVDLISKIIFNSSAQKHLVYDPFLGSGSTLIACEKTGRKCYGMELDPHYCDVILTRWEKFTGKQATLC